MWCPRLCRTGPNLDRRFEPRCIVDRPGLKEGQFRHRFDRAEYRRPAGGAESCLRCALVALAGSLEGGECAALNRQCLAGYAYDHRERRGGLALAVRAVADTSPDWLRVDAIGHGTAQAAARDVSTCIGHAPATLLRPTFARRTASATVPLLAPRANRVSWASLGGVAPQHKCGSRPARKPIACVCRNRRRQKCQSPIGAAPEFPRSWEEKCVMPCWASVSMSSLAAASNRLPRGTSVRRNHEISCAVLARVAAYSAGAVSTASAAASAIATVVSAAPLLIKAPGMTADTPSPT